MPGSARQPRPRGLMAGAIGVSVVLLLGCVGFVEVAGEHDAFAWWAEIFIPSAVGAATVLVSYAAFVASRRATDLAHELERQREANEAQRSADERKRRLQDMALDEARALTAWLVLAMSDRNWRHRKIEDVGEARHGPTRQHDAVVRLQQSIVPGAQQLLAISTIDVEKAYVFKPDAMYMPDRERSSFDVYAESDLLNKEVPAFRRERSIARVRAWALDPEGAFSGIEEDLAMATSDLGRYMDYRQGLDRDDLLPLEQLPAPPHGHAERVAFFVASGMIQRGPSEQ